MAYCEFVFVYVFRSEQERIHFDESDGSSTPIIFRNLHPNVSKKKNVIVIYWSNDKNNPLLMKQFSNAMESL